MKQIESLMGWLIAFIISGLMLTGCTEKAKKTEKKSVKVETLSVGDTNLKGTKDYVGTIEEKMGSTLSFEIAGNITSIRVDEGDRVSKGQLLATINPTTVKEAHRATLTTLKQAEDAYRRFQPLHQSGTLGHEMGGDRKQIGTGKSCRKYRPTTTLPLYHHCPLCGCHCC